MGKEIIYTIKYLRSVLERDVPAIDSFWKREIDEAISSKLTIRPEFYGKPLRQNLKGLWRLRVGAYRIVYQIQAKTVLIIIIDHRKDVYTEVQKRLVR